MTLVKWFCSDETFPFSNDPDEQRMMMEEAKMWVHHFPNPKKTFLWVPQCRTKLSGYWNHGKQKPWRIGGRNYWIILDFPPKFWLNLCWHLGTHLIHVASVNGIKKSLRQNKGTIPNNLHHTVAITTSLLASSTS